MSKTLFEVYKRITSDFVKVLAFMVLYKKVEVEVCTRLVLFPSEVRWKVTTIKALTYPVKSLNNQDRLLSST